MKYDFIKFDGTAPRGDTKIAINHSGLVRLSSGFCRSTNVMNFKYSLLYYDRLNNAVAFKFVNKKEDGIVTVTRDGTAATLSAKSFFTANKIDLNTVFGRYDWKKMTIPDIGEVYIINFAKK